MKILITGASDSGTKTLGAYANTQLNWSVIDSDDLYWEITTPPFTAARDNKERNRLILLELNRHDNVIVSGFIMKWGEPIESSFDLIVFLTLNTDIRIDRLIKREVELYGEADPEFIQWASQYDTGTTQGRSLTNHQKWLAQQTSDVIRIDGDLTVQQRCTLVEQAIRK